MQNDRSSFRVQKLALITAAAGCLALNFATPIQQAAATDHQDNVAFEICPRPGTEALIEGGTVNGNQEARQIAAIPAIDDTSENAIRVATYNVDLSRDSAGKLFEELSVPGTPDAVEAARVIQSVRPDILVLTGIDVDTGKNMAKAFNTNYLAVGSETSTGINYPYYYSGPSNAGVDSGADLDRDGVIGGPGDALGYGEFPGQASMLIYSKYPLHTDEIRDFSALPWKNIPDNNMPTDFSELESSILPLASVSHWDIPADIGGQTLHILASAGADASLTPHDDARNEDQIRFWQDYLNPETQYILDHRGERGPLEQDAAFVLAGSLKADPESDGPVTSNAMEELLASERITDPQPTKILPQNATHQELLPYSIATGHDTAPHPAQEDQRYRADYVLVDTTLAVEDSGILVTNHTQEPADGHFTFLSQDEAHHMVWADIVLGN